VPGDITSDQLDPQAAAELRTLPGDLADAVARYLVAAGREEDPERAYEYARAARGLAARVGIVRETSAIAAYQAGKWADALAEFRAARRLTGRDSYLPLMADSERALGRLDRALDLVTGPEARAADRATQLELLIVESGIRRDQGLTEAAVVALQIPELKERRGRAGNARLLYAYADALLEAGREEEAREWFGRAAAADTAGETDAAERVDELDDVLFEDLDDSDEDDESEDEDDLEEVDDLDDDDSDEDAEDDDSEDEDLDDEDDLEDEDDPGQDEPAK
jgi:tetratricopeptide (TPR) repeat protein